MSVNNNNNNNNNVAHQALRKKITITPGGNWKLKSLLKTSKSFVASSESRMLY